MTAPVRKARIGGAEIEYRGAVGEIDVSDGEDGPGARYVFTEYIRTDLTDDERAARPVLFAFNGGPGSSSVWLHLGLGPRRVADADTLHPRMAPPFALVDNDDSPLDVADLVFIDPPGTGYSRIHPDADRERFHGVEQDARATLEFIGRWVRRNGREQSPRFVMGESYGTHRAARMSRLANGGPMRGGTTRATSLNGAIVLGPAFGLGEPAWNGDVRAALEFPTLVHTARHHGAVSDLSDDDVSDFARTELLPALVAGTQLDDAEREALAARMGGLLGLPAPVLIEHDLRITPDAFARLALRAEGRQLGMYDSRYTLSAQGAGSDPVADDPAMGAYAPQFTGAIQHYLREELGYASDDEYRAIDFRLAMGGWDWDGHDSPHSNCFGDFTEAVRRDERFELMIGVGEYDLVTTRAATEFTFTRFRFDRSRVHLKVYGSGHMPYLGEAPRVALATDIRGFVGAGAAR
ncbi:S10 family peptidase [Microbacterium sp.]|uniref:S10 family peptidase n=1 Tax=Microbacterium sp. TaxID=51671 RepID=UPI003A9378C6